MRALIMEDDRYTREALVEILQTEGWETVACADGPTVLQVFRPGHFDLVCLDIMVPGASGYDVCRHIRSLDRQPGVLFISAKSEEIDKVLGLELGADDFLVKPFGVRELLARVRAVMRRRQATPAPLASPAPEHRPLLAGGQQGAQDRSDGPVLGRGLRLPGAGVFAFAAWEVRPEELRMYNQAARQDLSSRELSMLALMAANPGKVIRREDFYRYCWELENPPQSRTLDQHMAKLRRKLELGGQDSRVSTVQGQGYRYEP